MKYITLQTTELRFTAEVCCVCVGDATRNLQYSNKGVEYK